MTPHPYDENPDVPGICQCDLPKPNGIHRAQPVAAPTALRQLTSTVAPVSFNGRSASLRAALKAAPKSSTVKGQVLTLIARAPRARGLTDADIGHALPKAKANTLRPRRIDLVEEGWIEPVVDEASGEVLQRGGFTAWRLTEAAYLFLTRPAA